MRPLVSLVGQIARECALAYQITQLCVQAVMLTATNLALFIVHHPFPGLWSVLIRVSKKVQNWVPHHVYFSLECVHSSYQTTSFKLASQDAHELLIK